MNGLETSENWSPPSCIFTTPPPTTTKAPDEIVGDTETLEGILEENDQLRAKIDGLKDEYAKIGLKVFEAFKEDFWASLQFSVDARNALPAANLTDLLMDA